MNPKVRLENMCEGEMSVIGNNLAQILRMKRDQKQRDRWQTRWGSKTGLGLFRTIVGIVKDAQNGELHHTLTDPPP